MPTPVRVIPNEAASVELLAEKTIAVLGYGAQGSAHAQNLRDSGCKLIVAQRPGGQRHVSALDDGFLPVSIEEAVAAADLLIFGLPDDAAGAIFEQQIRPRLRAGQALGFIHGFAIHYEQVRPPPDVDVILVAPKAQGRGVRREFVNGRGVLALVAIHQDASGGARSIALGWAAGIGAARAGMLETTFADETETDLFGEQAVLCGGMSALIKAGFETLVEAGYPPELAFFECCHEIKLLADLVHDAGITGMRQRISSTARFGDLTAGPRIVTDQTRNSMRALLAEIRSGTFASKFLADRAAGGATSEPLLEADSRHGVEDVGRRMRALMWGDDGPAT